MEKRNASITTKIVGARHHPHSASTMSCLSDKDTLTLEREPDNKFDPSAVAVYYGETKLGYIPTVDATTIARVMDEGYSWTCRVVSSAPAIRISWLLDKEDEDPFTLD